MTESRLKSLARVKEILMSSYIFIILYVAMEGLIQQLLERMVRFLMLQIVDIRLSL